MHPGQRAPAVDSGAGGQVGVEQAINGRGGKLVAPAVEGVQGGQRRLKGPAAVAAQALVAGQPMPAVKLLLHPDADMRSEEHTSELQSRGHLVRRLLLEKKN